MRCSSLEIVLAISNELASHKEDFIACHYIIVVCEGVLVRSTNQSNSSLVRVSSLLISNKDFSRVGDDLLCL